MKILAIDTSTEACSAAVYIDGDSRERFEIARQRHTELILPMIESLLAESGLNNVKDFDALAFGRGPGSFTGIRIGTGVVQGIALGAGLDVAPVSTLAAIAQGVYRVRQEKNVLAAIDARMQEIYWGCYQLDEQGYMQASQTEVVGKPDDLQLPEQDTPGWYGAGSAWAAYEQDLCRISAGRLSSYDGSVLPHAMDVAHLACDVINKGGLVTAEHIEPVYLRNEVAWKKPG
jgi:tRNA threonylcarbamoyladenosine biosynthesis protein TsaB